MCSSDLISREVIADSIELCGIGYSFDACVIIVGCDKTIPAGAMALARLNIPGLVLYSGSIAPGVWEGHDVTIQDGDLATPVAEEADDDLRGGGLAGAGEAGEPDADTAPVRSRHQPPTVGAFE